jgi:hypothetical protein
MLVEIVSINEQGNMRKKRIMRSKIGKTNKLITKVNMHQSHCLDIMLRVRSVLVLNLLLTKSSFQNLFNVMLFTSEQKKANGVTLRQKAEGSS